jgi:hypothetical protein
MSEEQKPEIWTPPEAIDENTRRMAWLLFLEWWKFNLESPPMEDVAEQTRNAYNNCLATAKLVRAQEQQTTVKVESDEPSS